MYLCRSRFASQWSSFVFFFLRWKFCNFSPLLLLLLLLFFAWDTIEHAIATANDLLGQFLPLNISMSKKPRKNLSCGIIIGHDLWVHHHKTFSTSSRFPTKEDAIFNFSETSQWIFENGTHPNVHCSLPQCLSFAMKKILSIVKRFFKCRWRSSRAPSCWSMRLWKELNFYGKTEGPYQGHYQ